MYYANKSTPDLCVVKTKKVKISDRERFAEYPAIVYAIKPYVSSLSKKTIRVKNPDGIFLLGGSIAHAIGKKVEPTRNSLTLYCGPRSNIN